MPQYLGLIRIDWHVADTPTELHQALVDANASLDSSYHTFQTFQEQLERIANEQPKLVADVLIDDGYRHYFLYRLEKGEFRELELEERPEDALATAIELPTDDVAFELPLEYDSEDELREAVAEAADAADEAAAFVAEVKLSRYIVEIAPGRSSVRRLAFVGERALAEHLLRAEYATPPPPPRDPAEKYELGLYWPEDMLREIQEHAVRCDKSLSWIVQFAWKKSHPRLSSSDRFTLSEAIRGYRGDKCKQTLFYPGSMLDQIEAESRRLDSSQSYVVQAAFALARGEIAKLAAD